MHQQQPTSSCCLRFFSIPELASNVFQFLQLPDILALRFVNKAFEQTCAPYVTIILHSCDVLEALSVSSSEDAKAFRQLTTPREFTSSRSLSIRYHTDLSPSVGEFDGDLTRSPNLISLFVQPHHSQADIDANLAWFKTHDRLLPSVRSVYLETNADSFPANSALDLEILPTRTPSLESLTIVNGHAIDFGVLLRALDCWPHLTSLSLQTGKMMMSDNRACRGPDGAYKVYPKVETLELVNMELEPYEDGWTLFDMFPNVRHLRVQPSDDCTRLLQRNQGQDQHQQLQLLPPFPKLTSFRTRIDSSSDIDSFYALMGLPPGFSVPTDSTHQQHQQQEQQQQQNNPQTGSSSLTALSVHHRPHLGSPPPLRKLSFEIGIALGDCLEMLGTIGQVLAFLGISLTQLHCHNFCLWSYDIIMTTTSLEEHSYRGLEALIIEDPIYLDKFLDSIFTPVPVRSLNTSGSLSKGSVQESDQDQDPVTVPILSTLSWMISLTTLHLKDIHETPEIVPRLNKWLKMFPYLVHFTLDYGLTDLAIFHGMGRIPVHHQQQEAEAEVVEEEFNSAALDSIQLGVGGNPNGGGEEVVGSQQEYILRRPLLKNLKINITGSNLTVDEARASLHGRFPQLTQLIVHSVETSKQ